MIPLPPDPWKMLGVEKNADKSDIRSAYKKLVLKTHPDKVQDPTLKAEKQEQFQKIQQAAVAPGRLVHGRRRGLGEKSDGGEMMSGGECGE